MSSEEKKYIEEINPNHFSVKYDVNSLDFSEKGPFQKVEVYSTKGHGKMLLNDDLVMISERDEFVYHDMISHVPLFSHPCPKKVLIIGGGDGGTAREVLRHESVEKCVMVEIDELVVNACKKFIPQTSISFKNSKLELLIEDGVEYIKNTKEKFDVIIIDSTDPIGPATPLFNSDFYGNVYKALSDDGIVVSQAESPFYEQKMQKKLFEILNELFPIVRMYNYSNITYPGGLWSFTFASKKIHPTKDFDASRVEKSELEFEYYNAKIHGASFCLPEFMLKNLRN
jgi:spermidine synthase